MTCCAADSRITYTTPTNGCSSTAENGQDWQWRESKADDRATIVGHQQNRRLDTLSKTDGAAPTLFSHLSANPAPPGTGGSLPSSGRTLTCFLGAGQHLPHNEGQVGGGEEGERRLVGRHKLAHRSRQVAQQLQREGGGRVGWAEQCKGVLRCRSGRARGRHETQQLRGELNVLLTLPMTEGTSTEMSRLTSRATMSMLRSKPAGSSARFEKLQITSNGLQTCPNTSPTDTQGPPTHQPSPRPTQHQHCQLTCAGKQRTQPGRHGENADDVGAGCGAGKEWQPSLWG